MGMPLISDLYPLCLSDERCEIFVKSEYLFVAATNMLVPCPESICKKIQEPLKAHHLPTNVLRSNIVVMYLAHWIGVELWFYMLRQQKIFLNHLLYTPMSPQNFLPYILVEAYPRVVEEAHSPRLIDCASVPIFILILLLVLVLAQPGMLLWLLLFETQPWKRIFKTILSQPSIWS